MNTRTVAIYRIHDHDAVRELERNAYNLNNVKYDHNGNFIQQIRLENLYSAFIMLNSKPDSSQTLIKCDDIKDLKESFEINLNTTAPILLNNEIQSYGICLFNKWCGFNDIKINKFTKGNSISEYIYNDSKSNIEYQERLNNLSKKLFWYGSTHVSQILTLSLDEINKLKIDHHKQLLKKLPKNPYIGQHIYESITSRIYDDIPEHHQLKKLTNIKVRKTQLSRLIGAIGYIADDMNMVSPNALSSSIFSGLDPDIFFLTSRGTRKGIVDKSRATPDSGYLERSMVVNLSPIELDLDNCKTKLGLNITIQSKEHAKSLINKWYYDSISGTDILYNPSNLEEEIGKIIVFRSPVTCANPDFKICKHCFGEYPVTTPYIGILAGQYIAERMTQLSMKTFHTSGSSTLPTNSIITDLLYKKLIDIELADSHSTIIIDGSITPEQSEILTTIKGFIKFETEKTITKILYLNTGEVENYDVTQIINSINQLLRRQDFQTIDKFPMDVVYSEYIKSVLDIGQIYSSFVELVLCNMYLTKDKQILRYALQSDVNAKAHFKLSIKKLHTVVSSLLGLIYEPNRVSIDAYSVSKSSTSSNTIFEKVWNGII